ncbi:MAG: hypothetical protein R3F37_17115 [Candidatus Competibacteraceae bacterium]
MATGTSGQKDQRATVIPYVVSLPSVSSLPWNPCPVSYGMGVQFAVESLSTLAWNTHICREMWILGENSTVARGSVCMYLQTTLPIKESIKRWVAEISAMMSEDGVAANAQLVIRKRFSTLFERSEIERSDVEIALKQLAMGWAANN